MLDIVLNLSSCLLLKCASDMIINFKKKQINKTKYAYANADEDDEG